MMCQSEALSDPVKGEYNEMDPWGVGVIFQSTPCSALLNFTCSSFCPGGHSGSVESCTEPVTTKSLGDMC